MHAAAAPGNGIVGNGAVRDNTVRGVDAATTGCRVARDGGVIDTDGACPGGDGPCSGLHQEQSHHH